MKRLLLIAGVALGFLALSVVSARAQGNVLKEARVTQVVKDVKLLVAQGEPRPATLTDTVRGNTAVRTGAESRAELTFGDLTIARLGANTIFSFDQGTRTVDLGNGAILLRVPKGSGGAKVQTAAVTAAITGTTVIVEYHPKSYAKYLVLEGTMRLYIKGTLGESVLLGPGQMMILNPNATRLSEAVDFDLERLLSTSVFIQGFRPLPSETLMADVQRAQFEKKAAGELIDTNLVIFGRGTLVTLTDPQSLDVIDRATAASTLPTPTPAVVLPPSKIGRPPVIANSAAYQIAGASAIQTDPSITSPGRTDFGKIYRGPGPDANFSIWSFDTTRAFDTSSGFDAFYSGAGVLIAAFKFQSLVLAGDSTISTANGGATFLELIGVDGITSGPPGGPLTFPGINNLLLAAQNGSILLGPEISFQNIPALFLYARGTGSNIVLGSPISGTRDLFLDAEGSVQINGAETVTNFRSVTGGDFLAGTGPVNASTIDIRSGGNLNFTLSQFAVGGRLGGTVTLNAGGAVNIDTRGDQTVFNNASSVLVTGQTISLLGNNPTQISFALARIANFTAGTGGFQAATVAFNGASLLNITSGADINVFRLSNAASITAGTSISAVGDLTAVGAITAGTTINAGGTLGTNFSNITAGQSITAGADLNGGLVQAGTLIDVGGNLTAAFVRAGTNIRVTGNMSPFSGATAGGSIAVGGNLGTTGDITAGTTMNVGGNFNAPNITAGQSITVNGNLAATNSATAGTTINVGGNFDAPTITAGQSITVGNNLTATNSATAGTTINVGGTFRAPIATAGGDISANRITLLNVTTPGILRGGVITPFIPATPANLLHSFTVSSIVAPGGIDFRGDNFVAAGDGIDGGKLSIFANTITFDLANIASANFNGASGVPTNSAGGSGGNLTITTSGAITANAPIQATTGLNPTGVAFGGTGGAVSLTSTAGAVNVNSSILVSSNDPNGPAPAPLRRSAAGGTLSLFSGLKTGNAITLGGGAQLFSLLNAGAPGPAGGITISSAGGNIIDTGATIEADRGTITIQHTAPASAGSAQITLNGGMITSETLFALSRGDLTVGTTTPVNLVAVTLSLLANGNLTWNGGTLTAAAIASPGNVIFQAGNDLSITGAADIERSNGGIADGLNLTLSAGRNLQTNGGLTLLTEGSGLTSGANITLNSGAAMTLGGVTTVRTGPALGDQVAGSNISLTAGGPITVGNLSATVQLGAGRTLGNGGALSVSGAGSYTATAAGGGLGLLVNNSAPGIIGTGGNINLTLTGGLTTTTGALQLLINNSNGGRIQTGGNITSSIGGNLRADQVSVQVDNRFNGFIGNAAAINFTVGGTFNTTANANFTILNSQRGTPGGTIVSDAAIKLTLGNTTIGGGLNAFIDNADGKIGGTGGLVTLLINGNLSVTGRVNVNGALTVTDTLLAGTLSGTNVNSPGVVVGAGGITPFTFPNEVFPSFLQHTITTIVLSSSGGINFNGPDFAAGTGGPFNGGRLTLNVASLTFGPSPADDIQGPVTFNGGSSTTAAAGDGGIFTVNATRDITVGTAIEATTGFQSGSAAIANGAGGTVNLNSATGTVTVNSPITVSSAENSSVAPPPPRRRSAQGGNINLKSDRPESAAITINNSGQLLSLLDASAPGPGGKITILATGQMSIIRVNGPAPGTPATDTIAADRGSVDIRHTGLNGAIVLNGANIRADIVKVGALGDNGTLTIGGGTISADTILKLYAIGPAGSVTFVASVNLNGNSTKTIAGNSITINTGVRVNVGGPNPAQIFVNFDAAGKPQANYSGFGGNGTTNGTFTGAGANDPQPLANAPAFGPPGGP
jgi:mannose-6-phosphate isomerase-like protein (cupin superfamily)